jgi:ribosome-binding protein aMBF1 (putative translation factor)
MKEPKTLAEWRAQTQRNPVPRRKGQNRNTEEQMRYGIYAGTICREMRERRSLSQEAVAQALGMSRAMVASLENGYQTLAVSRYPVLARVLGIKTLDLLPEDFTK